MICTFKHATIISQDFILKLHRIESQFYVHVNVYFYAFVPPVITDPKSLKKWSLTFFPEHHTSGVQMWFHGDSNTEQSNIGCIWVI